jgi:hypothetical protein
MSQQSLKPPAEQLPGQPAPAGRAEPGDGIPFDTTKLSQQDRDWVLRAYNERSQFQRELETMRGDRERLDQELRNRDQLLMTLSSRMTEQGNQQGIVPREQTEPIERELRRIDYDPWAPDANERLTAEVERIALEVAQRGDKALSDWYLKDRQGFWQAVTQQDSLVAHYMTEWMDLHRENPKLSVADFTKAIEAAPKFNYSLKQAYESVHPERIREAVRDEERARVQAELERQIKAPPAAAPPVLGGPTAYPRRRAESPRPKSYADATRMAYESAGEKLFE